MNFIDRELQILKNIWQHRSLVYGERCVFNLAHDQNHYAVVDFQIKNIVYPYLLKALKGTERSVLDFGCGAGRLTEDLHHFVNGGTVVGFDISENLISMARRATPEAIFISDYAILDRKNYQNFFDLIVVYTVFGGFSDNLCISTADFLSSRLADGGLLLMVENTSEEHQGNNFWKIRPQSWYLELFPLIDLNVVGKYFDCGNETSILIGRHRALRP